MELLSRKNVLLDGEEYVFELFYISAEEVDTCLEEGDELTGTVDGGALLTRYTPKNMHDVKS